jgi:DNA-binding SARP family transcriptional activator/tetratricopeptide (TPR) repeat protein
MVVRFRLLGAIDVLDDDRPIPLGYGQLRCMLAVLLVEANHPVSVDQLVDRVWVAGHLPRQPRRAVQHNVALLRRSLASAAEVTLVRSGPGYQLSTDPDTVDLHRFAGLLQQARAVTDGRRDEQAAGLLEQALALWRGEPFADLDIDTAWLHGQRATVTARRHAARLDLTDIRLRQGSHVALLTDLAEQARLHPLDERLAGQYLLALYRSGRQAQALEHYHHLQRVLAQELGTDPVPPLQRLYQRILTADPTLAAPVAQITVAGPPTPRQLPAPPSLFTGRGLELAVLDTTVGTRPDAGRTVMISAIGGCGGIGKTWLALHWAYQHLDRFPDGQLHVNLRGFDATGRSLSPAVAVRGFLGALGVAPAAIPVDLQAQIGLYRSLVADRRMLIVLDNARDTDQVTPLLPGSPNCTVLVTSRHHLTGLVTTHGAHVLDLDVLPKSEARQLLVRHLGHERVAAEPRAVADLLSCCAGLPLAVSIVAARASRHPAFPLAALAEELRDAATRLDGLDAGDLRVNLRAVLSWSVRALHSPAARMFGLLGIAPGSDISLPAAACLAGLPMERARLVLRELENTSLIAQHLPGRYRMHDLIRLYAADTAYRDKAQEAPDAALRRILDFYIHTAYCADRVLDPARLPIHLDAPAPGVHRLSPFEGPAAATAWLDAEHANLVAAQQLAASHNKHHIVWRIAWVLDTFHYWQGHGHDRVAAWQAALDAAAHLPDPAARMIAYRRLGHAHTNLGHHDKAIESLHHALTLAEEYHDTPQQAITHRMIALAWLRQGDDQHALDHATRGLDLFHALQQPVSEANAHNAVGWCAARLGRYATARAHCRAALSLFRHHPDPDGEANALDSLGYIAHRTGRHRHAIRYYQRALTVFRDSSNSYEAATTLDNLGQVRLALGEHRQARADWREAVRLYQRQGRDNDANRVQQQLDDLDSPTTTSHPTRSDRAGSDRQTGG